MPRRRARAGWPSSRGATAPTRTRSATPPLRTPPPWSSTTWAPATPMKPSPCPTQWKQWLLRTFEKHVTNLLENSRDPQKPISWHNSEQSKGLEDVVAIMIPEPKGKEIVSLLERNITVMMYITIGTRNLQKYVSRTSVVFVSISFIVLMIISLAWLVFYYIQRFRYANARDRNQRRLGDAAKKAISKLQVRTIRKGDKETEPDFDNCAVCIEGYKPNDVVRILPCRHLFHKSCVDPWLLDHRTCPMCKMNILKALGIPPNADCMDDIPPDLEASIGGPPTNQITGASDITVNESSVTLDPPVRTVGVLQVIQDVDSFPQVGEGNFTTSNEQEPAVSSDSDISLIMAMEVGLSDVELSTDQDCEEVKS
ncbi:RING finger protein 150 isoform 3-T4 [Theristicus caerulescens]